MSGFWSGWVIFLAVLTIGISVALFVGGMRVKLPTQADGTTGHDWDGVREGVRNLRQSGLIKVRSGITSLEEIEAVTNE